LNNLLSVDLIDITFDFRSDTPLGKDPDTYSPTLLWYHRLLWSKPLPSAAPFKLDIKTPPPMYLHHLSQLGEFWLSSDAVIPTFTRWPRLKHITEQIPEAENEAFRTIGYTIGAMMVCPGNKIDRKPTLNGARGFHPKIRDRFDLTVECIRRHYTGLLPNPLGDCLARYPDFFRLFGDFAGYVEFFLLQDLVDDVSSTVKFFMPFDNFTGSQLPSNLDAYLGYRQRAIEFIESRNRRIVSYARSGLEIDSSVTKPVIEDAKLKAVLAQAQANGDRAVFDAFLAVGERLGLYARPYVVGVMFTPPRNKTRMLFTLGTGKGGIQL
jgi:hypothetical protein